MATSRAAGLANEIEAEIVSGAIATGLRLGTKEELRLKHDVAYGTLNEALRILQQRGYVSSRTGPGGGLFASRPNAQLRLSHLILGYREGGTLADCAVVRHALEEQMVADAATARTREDIERLHAILSQMRDVFDEPGRYLEHNWRLHRAIAQACRNRILGAIYCTLLDAEESQVERIVPDPLFSKRVSANFSVHCEIVAAIEHGDPERARTAATAHEAFFGRFASSPRPMPPQRESEFRRARIPHPAPSSAP